MNSSCQYVHTHTHIYSQLKQVKIKNENQTYSSWPFIFLNGRIRPDVMKTPILLNKSIFHKSFKGTLLPFWIFPNSEHITHKTKTLKLPKVSLVNVFFHF